jgi:hypothetical protein
VLIPVKSSLSDRYLKNGKGIVAAEHIPPEDWIIFARQYRKRGVWPSTLGPPAGKPGSSCPPEFAKEASMVRITVYPMGRGRFEVLTPAPDICQRRSRSASRHLRRNAAADLGPRNDRSQETPCRK